MAFQSSPSLVFALQFSTSIGLVLIGGISSCLSLWVMPLTKLLPPRYACRQSTQTVKWGEKYLQFSSRALSFLLLTTAILTSRLPDSREAAGWRVWAMCWAAVVPIAPYEIYTIFPINDRIEEIGAKLARNEDVGEKVEKEVTVLLNSWKWRNWVRAGLPTIVGVVGLLKLSR